jgi:uncharacterized protein
MAVKSNKPILVAGVGLSLALWLWDSLEHSIAHLGELSMVGTIALGAGVWWLQARSQKKNLLPVSTSVDRTEVETAIALAKKLITNLESEAAERDISQLKQQVDRLPELLNKKDLQIAIVGGKNVGKTTLQNQLDSQQIATQISFIDTEALLTQDNSADIKTEELALKSDLAMFITAGDLTDSEWEVIQQIRNSRQRALVIFNKQDQYLPEERDCILQQIQHRVRELIAAEDVMAIALEPQQQKVRQHQEDGTVKEWLETRAPEINNLSDRLTQIISKDKEQLIYGTTWRTANQLKQQAKQILNEIRRDRAVPVIEQYQWIAAAAAFANPVASLDLLATAAINAQMLMDLSNIYQQKFSLSQAQTATGTIGKLMVQLGLVELSTNAIAGILKTNAFTYVAGGAVQGISAAYLTRLAGLSLIEYFQEQEVCLDFGEGLNLEKLGQKLRQVFEQNQRGAFLQNFVKQGISHLLPEKQQPAISTN